MKSSPPRTLKGWSSASAWFTTVPLKTLSDQVWIRYQGFCLFKLFIFNCSFSTRVIAHHLFMRSNKELQRKNTLFKSEKRRYLPIFAKIKVSMVLLQIRHCHLCMEGQLKSVPLSPFKMLKSFYYILGKDNSEINSKLWNKNICKYECAS